MLTIRPELLALPKQPRILDLGCGQGRHAFALWLHYDAQVMGLDLDPENIVYCQEKFTKEVAFWKPEHSNELSFAVGDALATPFEDASMDMVVCSEVLEHIPDYKAALSEIRRILRPGGTFAMSVPRSWPERICWWLDERYQNQPGGHLRIFAAQDLRQEIEREGFHHFRTHFAHGLHSPYWWLQCAFWDQRDSSPIIRSYRRFLEWDILEQPPLTRYMEAVAGPLMGKSVVMYFTAK